MQFDWTTFALELLNFLVLLWLLKRFFYKPVLAAIDARKQAIQQQTNQAAATKSEAEALKAQYETGLQSWKQEQERLRQALEQELAQERARRLDALKKALDEERANAKVREEALDAQREARLARQATERAYVEAAAMLKRLAIPALTERIAEIVAEDLVLLPQERRAALREAAAALGQEEAVEIAAAHTLDNAMLQILSGAMQEIAGKPLRVTLAEQPALIAGLRIAFGQYLLQANVSDELAFFREGARDGGGA